MLQIIIFIQIIEISILFLNILMIQTHISIIVIDIEKKNKRMSGTSTFGSSFCIISTLEYHM